MIHGALLTAALVLGASPFATAKTAYDKGDCEKAEPLYRDALASKSGKNAPDRGDALINWGDCLRREAQYDKALEVSREALELNRKSDPSSKKTRDSLALVGLILEEQGRKDEGIAKLREALILSNKLTAAGGKPDGTIELALGAVLVRDGQAEEGRSLVESAASIVAARAGLDSVAFAAATVALGQAKFVQRDFAGAEADYRKALPAFRSKLGAEQLETLTAEGDLSLALEAQGKLTDAEPIAEHAAISAEKRVGPHPSTAKLLYDLAELKRKLNKRNEAIDLFKRVVQMENKLGRKELSARAWEQINDLTGE